MTEGSCAYSAISLSAGGQDEQPWLVNNSMTARVSPPCAHCTDNIPQQASTNEDARRTPIMMIFPRRPAEPRPVSSYPGNKSPATHFAVSGGCDKIDQKRQPRPQAGAARTAECRH